MNEKIKKAYEKFKKQDNFINELKDKIKNQEEQLNMINFKLNNSSLSNTIINNGNFLQQKYDSLNLEHCPESTTNFLNEMIQNN